MMFLLAWLATGAAAIELPPMPPMAITAEQAMEAYHGEIRAIISPTHCPDRDDAGEIVVCGRHDRDADRYRLPLRNLPPEPGSPQSLTVAAERQGLLDHGDSGIHSCSATGGGGWTGCLLKQWRASNLSGRRGKLRF